MYEQIYVKVYDWDAKWKARGVRDLSTCEGCGCVLAYCSCPYEYNEKGVLRRVPKHNPVSTQL